jgi:hypothetical protein
MAGKRGGLMRVQKNDVSSRDRDLARLLDEARYFAREENLARLAVFFTVLAFSVALIFLTVLPWEGMRPLVVRFQGVWFRYSLLGDIALFLGCVERARHVRGRGDSLLPSATACLALAHALTSFRDPWGIFFSNALIEFLLFAAILILFYPVLRAASPRLLGIVCVIGSVFLLSVVFCSFFGHFFGLLGLTARSLPVRLFAAHEAGGFYVLMRWGFLFLSVLVIALSFYIIRIRMRLDPGLAGIRERAFGRHDRGAPRHTQ